MGKVGYKVQGTVNSVGLPGIPREKVTGMHFMHNHPRYDEPNWRRYLGGNTDRFSKEDFEMLMEYNFSIFEGVFHINKHSQQLKRNSLYWGMDEMVDDFDELGVTFVYLVNKKMLEEADFKSSFDVLAKKVIQDLGNSYEEIDLE